MYDINRSKHVGLLEKLKIASGKPEKHRNFIQTYCWAPGYVNWFGTLLDCRYFDGHYSSGNMYVIFQLRAPNTAHSKNYPFLLPLLNLQFTLHIRPFARHYAEYCAIDWLLGWSVGRLACSWMQSVVSVGLCDADSGLVQLSVNVVVCVVFACRYHRDSDWYVHLLEPGWRQYSRRGGVRQGRQGGVAAQGYDSRCFLSTEGSCSE